MNITWTKGRKNCGDGSMSLLIFHISVSGCKVDVQQPTKLIRKKEQQSVSIPCSVTVSSCPKSLPQISWYVFRKNSHYQLDLKSHSLRYTLEHQGLKISSLSEADSGVYYCAAALLDVAHNGAQAIGQGTTLKVSETGLNVSQALLLTLLVLLTVYSLLVLVIIICIKVQLQYSTHLFKVMPCYTFRRKGTKLSLVQ
uniref:Si:ch211-139g16.8 n=1 Tax=Sinocyclocheilus rhinocerous TaxID=307959 RepID=A0A673MKV2_9TELE